MVRILTVPRALRGPRLVQVHGGRDHGVYGIPGTPACANNAVNTYLVTGRLASAGVCPVDG
ncbi:alpha/beta hydrolase [Streptomyces sp. NPDC006265]|uniref:alpha/beta hydrolase n=1 Tax=Streptomyces sp. NPDC006265 TaxID=3156740 RepID=UPI0033B9322D